MGRRNKFFVPVVWLGILIGCVTSWIAVVAFVYHFAFLSFNGNEP